MIVKRFWHAAVGFGTTAILCMVALLGRGGASAHADALGRAPFSDARNPPLYLQLDAAAQSRADLGHAIFNTQWVPAGTANASRRDGVGPLFNAAACDACHNEGTHGRGPAADGEAPTALVMELDGDPRYGRTLNTAALDGFEPEAVVRIRYRNLTGRYPDGAAWTLREPRYLVSDLKYGPLSRRTLLEPRLAPALFGVGLLEAVPGLVMRRFGWQGTSMSIRDQTTKAFARDMGLTSADVAKDDCTTSQPACLGAPNGGVPEVADEFLEALVEFQRSLAVPQRIIPTAGLPERDQMFVKLGCAACHRERLPVVLRAAGGVVQSGNIDPYTDLRLHDLGRGLADRTVAGNAAHSRWRTAPLWGLGYRLRSERTPTFLHDGRARSVEEAILWLAGEADLARRKFQRLSGTERGQLLRWIETL